MSANRSKPSGLSYEHASQFQDASMVHAYRHRVPYPAQTFDVLRELAGTPEPTVLDLGCGTGDVTVGLASFASRVDAIDVSAGMIAVATQRSLTRNNVQWLLGFVESAPVSGPYDLMTAGQSLPWMDRPVVFCQAKTAASSRSLPCHCRTRLRRHLVVERRLPGDHQASLHEP